MLDCFLDEVRADDGAAEKMGAKTEDQLGWEGVLEGQVASDGATLGFCCERSLLVCWTILIDRYWQRNSITLVLSNSNRDLQDTRAET